MTLLSKILVVEDEAALREGLRDLLQGEGYRVETAVDGEMALRIGSDASVQLVLLDLMIPRVDGLTVCQRLKELRPELPILMLTALGSEDDKVRGLRLGADDYVTKPFGSRELLARIEALARRAWLVSAAPMEIRHGDMAIDIGRCEVRQGDRTTPLTAREAEILRWLYQRRERAVTRAELLEGVWGARGDLQTRTVDMTIANLRRKIEPRLESPELIVTVKGVGYAWGPREP